jgi:hypothetical protein
MTLTQITTGGVDENINIDSNTLKVDGTNNRVGIGTAAPSQQLHIASANSSSSGTIIASDSQGRGVLIESPYIGNSVGKIGISGTDSALAFGSGSSNSERMRIDSSGNVQVTGSVGNTILKNSGAEVEFTRAGGSFLTASNASGFLGFQTGGINERMRIDSSGQLIIMGASASATNSLDFSYNSSSGQAQINADSDGGATYLTFGTSNSGSLSERLRIDHLGNVGIGNSSPHNSSGYNTLTIGNGTSTGGQLKLENAAGNDFYIWHDSNGSNIYNTSATSQIFYTNATERMRIGSDGVVQINQSTGNAFRVQNSTSGEANMLFQNSSTGTSVGNGLYVGIASNESSYMWAYHNEPMIWGTNNAERMRIDGLGRVFIGSTGFTSNNTVRINMSFNGAGTEYGMCMNAGSLVSGTKYITFYISTTNYGSIGWNGSQITYYNTSDYRLKENIVSLEGGIERLKQLQPRRFNFTHNRNMTVDGFVAHEAQAAVPEAVSGTHNEVDSDGNPVYQNIDQSKFVPLLTAALQEAITKIETLEAKVAALEAAE